MALPVRVTRGHIADPLDIIRQDFAMLNRMFGGGGLAGDTSDAGLLAGTGNFGVDVREDADHVYIEADLPGFQKDEIDISIDDGVLTISAEHREEAAAPPAQGEADSQQQQQQRRQGQPAQQGQQGQQGKGNYLLQERRYQRLVRSFTLPPNVDDQRVQATLENGVLKITLDKREDTKPRRIEVS